MKVLNIITSMRMGGAEKLLSEMLPIMRKKGCEVDLLLFDGVETELVETLIKSGVKVFSFGKNVNVYNPKFILKLIPYLKEYDVVHTHNTACQLFAAVACTLIKNKQKRPLMITTEHSTTNRRRNKPLFRRIDYWMYSRYNHIVAISEKAKEKLNEYLGTASIYVDLVFNGVNLEAFKKECDIKLKKDDEDVVVTMVAAFRKGKDQMTLIKAINLLPSNYHLCLVGDGEQRAANEKFASELGIENRVHFLGIRNDVVAILKASDVVVMSSEYEGLSLSSIEGLASGAPFIASDVDGLHEITSGAGLLFTLGDAKGLSDIILKLMNDNDLYVNTVDACINRSKQFDIETTVNRYLDLYGISMS